MDILVASRLAAHPDPVLRLAASLASGLAAELTLLTVARDAGAAAAAEDALADARAQLRSLPGAPSCRTRLRLGSPAAEILAELEASDPALVVLGERAQPKPLSRRVPGSTTRRVIERAPCPVMVAKGQGRAPRRLLLCDSGVTEAPLVEVLAAQLPGLLRQAASVTILHVASQMSAGPSVVAPELEGDADSPLEGSPERRLLDRDAASLAGLGIAAELKLRHGLVVEEVLAESETGQADLVIIGANRGRGWRRVLLSDFAREILQRMDRSVLIMRPSVETQTPGG